MQTIEVVFGKDGTVKIEGIGFKDAGCLDATKFIEETLGTVVERTEKREARVKPIKLMGQGGIKTGL